MQSDEEIDVVPATTPTGSSAIGTKRCKNKIMPDQDWEEAEDEAAHQQDTWVGEFGEEDAEYNEGEWDEGEQEEYEVESA